MSTPAAPNSTERGAASNTEAYIGVMSGTSLDGVDAVLVQFFQEKCQYVGDFSQEFALNLRAELLNLNTTGSDELHRVAQASWALADTYARAITPLLALARARGLQVRAVGVHGQTVRHRPPQASQAFGYTWQIHNPARLAELIGTDVVTDFRSRDVAAGGQGAPLVPPFHRAVFGAVDPRGAVVNIGGISNISLLDPAAPSAGFDCGPGNVLLDAWAHAHTGQAFDANGDWAASGRLNHALLDHLLAEPYFALPPPKSTGRDLFHLAWLQARLASFGAGVEPVDVQATLTELTARCIRSSVALFAPQAQHVLVCGGGARNAFLMQRLALLLPTSKVQPTDAHGIGAQHVEAAAFAWLARQFTLRRPGNLPAATGAAGPRILGALYPA